jgi:hypothetical protein
VIVHVATHLAGAVEQAAVAAMEVPGIPVWAIDADALVVRPGPRLVDGVEAIAAILHADAVPAPPDGQIALVARGGRDLLSDRPAGEPERSTWMTESAKPRSPTNPMGRMNPTATGWPRLTDSRTATARSVTATR